MSFIASEIKVARSDDIKILYTKAITSIFVHTLINWCVIKGIILNLLSHNYWRKVIAQDTTTTTHVTGLLTNIPQVFECFLCVLAQIALKVAILHRHQ